MKKRIFIHNRAFGFRISQKALLAGAILFAASHALPAVAHTQPFLGLGYSSIAMPGHSSRPGVTLFAWQRFHDNVQVNGSATLARSFYGFNASVGKDIAASSDVTFEPYLGAGLVSMNYNNQPVQASIQDSYALAGANVGWMVSPRIQLALGGGYGRTLTTLNGNGGSVVYKGEAEAAFGLSRHWAGDLKVSYLHLPGASLTSYGAGLSYHFR